MLAAALGRKRKMSPVTPEGVAKRAVAVLGRAKEMSATAPGGRLGRGTAALRRTLEMLAAALGRKRKMSPVTPEGVAKRAVADAGKGEGNVSDCSGGRLGKGETAALRRTLEMVAAALGRKRDMSPVTPEGVAKRAVAMLGRAKEMSATALAGV
ncbi:hypothetical protein MTO96_015148 [Rhipicephalus appendiculatus]